MEVKTSKQLYNKLLFTYTVIFVSAVLLLMIYFLYNTRNSYIEKNLEDMHKMSEEAENYAKESEQIASYLHAELYSSGMELEDLFHYLRDDPETYQRYRLDTYSKNYLSSYKGMEDFFTEAFEAYGSLKRITLVNYLRGDITASNGKNNIYQYGDNSEVMKRIEEENLADPGEFSFLKEIRDSDTMQGLGGMILTFQTDKLVRLQEKYPGAELLFYNDAGVVIYDSCEDCDLKGIEEARKADTLEKELDAYVEFMKVGSYTLIGYFPKSKAAEIPLILLVMIAGAGIAVIIGGEFLIHLYLQRLSGRLLHILDGMNRVMEGNLDVRLNADKNGDELDVISAQFNEMCRKLDLHIQKSYLAEIEQKNAEMAALQSQINPHFLYNTLEAIRMKAICNGDREVGKMLYSMAVTFRSQLKEADIITMAQEFHYCKKYMELFEFRYQNQFRAEVDCPEEFINVPIIKFVLQPIIENYFIHGIRMGEADNFIRLYVEKDDEVYRIVAEDNGRGMTREEMDEKNEQLRANKMDKTKSIGVANVNRRIKAVYGQEYGVHIEPREGGGLRVILRFKPSEGKEDEKGNDSRR